MHSNVLHDTINSHVAQDISKIHTYYTVSYWYPVHCNVMCCTKYSSKVNYNTDKIRVLTVTLSYPQLPKVFHNYSQLLMGSHIFIKSKTQLLTVTYSSSQFWIV